MHQIGIACTSIFHYIHFRHIAQELENNGFSVKYIICIPINNLNKSSYEELLNFFKCKNLKHCKLEQLLVETEKFEAILSPFFMPAFSFINPKIKLVRMLYGYAKDYWNYAEWNKKFDIVLSYGPYAENKLQKYSKIINIGHPRIKSTYKNQLIDLNGKYFPREFGKPILLYCPTWEELSSLDHFIENLSIFTENFVVVVKLHHGSIMIDNNFELNSIKKSNNLFIFDEFTDLFDLLYHCDLVLSDYSGAIFDAMLFRKPIILIDSLDSKGSKTQESLDLLIREILPHAPTPNEIVELLKRELNNKNLPYEKLINDLYSYVDELAPKRAVTAIKTILKENSSSEKKLQNDPKENIREFINNNIGQKIVIWGAGELGKIVYTWMKKEGYDIECFYDSDTNKQGIKIDGIVVKEPIYKGKIIITISTCKDEVIKTLKSFGLSENIDFIFVSVN
ncbi:CDP-glycerol glycerophosphotransferase family protein [Bacillus sp. Bva_UNVM-123]|uniref:CDP-glycerol glycerophosphotransferase family protein n=1 Tax=Bacillus sp. Bva_UNVM-123 TaxID=2829798 RepID=UPI00391EEB66